MGFDINGIRLLINAKQHNVNFEKSITIGRQSMHVAEKDLHELLTKSKLRTIKLEEYFESFFELLGAKTTESLDASQYEGATKVHDMNLQIPDEYRSKYTLVVDGGSLEHIFNFHVAIKNCMELIETNGHYIGITPTNNFFGHGFYQFSPELYYRVFSESNGFRIKKMFFYIDQKNGKTPIYEVSDPNDVKSRVTLQNSYPSYLFIIAQKTEQKEIFKKVPQQSDYENILWTNSPSEKKITAMRPVDLLRRLLPARIKKKVSKIRSSYRLLFQPTGISKSGFFRKSNVGI